MNLFLVIIALLLIVCIDHEVRINRLENDNDIIEGLFGVPPMIWGFFAGCVLLLLFVKRSEIKQLFNKRAKLPEWAANYGPRDGDGNVMN